MLNEKSSFKEFLNIAEGKRIIGFGAGRQIPRVVDILSKYNLYIDYLVDNDIWKWGYEHCGINVCSLAKLKTERTENIVVVICTENPFELERQLCDMEVSNYFAFCLWVSLIYSQTYTDNYVSISLRRS